MISAATNTSWAGAAGNAALSFCGRWTWRGLVLAFRHPINTGMALALTAGFGMGATNAMFMQTVRHPAPLFMDTASIASPVEPAEAVAPAATRQPIPTPLMRPVELVATPTPVPVSIPVAVGNKDVAELQARLTELDFFKGKIDGYYGPQTADAIRRFEMEAGLTPVGSVTPEVITAAKAFQLRVMPQPVVETQPAAVAPAETIAVASASLEPIVAPEDDPIGRIAASAAEVAAIDPVAEPEPVAKKPAAVDPELVRMVQTGLSRLGFLHAEISGKFDAETARAIREFENYNNFRVTGALTSDLIDVLMAAGAFN
jgi:peptidoglycan hydrolase-like protein with peptidoglycan-binding domain